MANIEEKSIHELTGKNKTIRLGIKKTIIGILLAGLTISFIPTLEYYVILRRIKGNTYIESVMQQDKGQTEKIAEIFAQGIHQNENISAELKELIISSFTKNVINEFGEYFTEETIDNMYAVALTEKVTTMSEFAQAHGWWTGDYNPYTNTFSIDEIDETLIAHEQLHAILKSGILGSGLAQGLKGYGLNEGVTSFLVHEDGGYTEETIIVNMLGIILGYDKVITPYVNGDLPALEKELNQYLNKKEAAELIRNVDINTFASYLETFLIKNKISYNEEALAKRNAARTTRIRELMRILFEKKYQTSIEKSQLGRVLFGKGSNYFDTNWNIEEPLYVIEYHNPEQVKVCIYIFDFPNEDYYGVNIVDIKDLETLDIDELMQQAKIAHQTPKIK